MAVCSIREYRVVMATKTRDDWHQPLTFENAPTNEVDGRLYVDRDAALELARRIATADASLLARLAQE
jgi:hypothetical protein